MTIQERIEEARKILEYLRIALRLEELRLAIREESISYGEIAELESLSDHIKAGDVELLEWAGVTEEQARTEGRI
jgi:hypothetical protein